MLFDRTMKVHAALTLGEALYLLENSQEIQVL